METQILEQGFRTVFWQETQEVPGEIQILRQVFRTETQSLIIITSPLQIKISKGMAINDLRVLEENSEMTIFSSR